jgi:hypothetical protein
MLSGVRVFYFDFFLYGVLRGLGGLFQIMVPINPSINQRNNQRRKWLSLVGAVPLLRVSVHVDVDVDVDMDMDENLIYIYIYIYVCMDVCMYIPSSPIPSYTH